ncbi:MAG: 50S ribosomal protein L13 [Candidatus Thermoplasmatota archaeon]
MLKIDASGLILGRISTHVAKALLRGEEVVIVNAEKAVITGSPTTILEDYRQRRARGKIRKGPYYPRTPDRILKRTVRGMLPHQTPKSRAALKRLKVYIGIPREMEGDTFETLEKAKMVEIAKYLTIGELSKELGAKL